MVVEPLGSIMSMQAQNSVPKKAVTSEKTDKTAETEKGLAVQEAAKADKTVNVVDDAKNKGTASNNGRDQQMAGARQQAANSGEQAEKNEKAENEKLRKAVEKLNKNMTNSEAIFGFHDETNRVMIKIIDKETKEVIKEIPPEKTLDMIAKVWELAGILVDEKR